MSLLNTRLTKLNFVLFFISDMKITIIVFLLY